MLGFGASRVSLPDWITPVSRACQFRPPPGWHHVTGREPSSLPMPAVARWVAVSARPRRCVRAAAAAGRGRGGGGYRQRAGGVLRDPYDTLGVATDASQAEVKLAFRKLVRTYHPDVNPDENAAARFRRINAAYEIVGDVERRRRFDLGQDWEVRPRTLVPREKKQITILEVYPSTPQNPTSPPTPSRRRRPWTRDGCPRRRQRRERGRRRTTRTRRDPKQRLSPGGCESEPTSR